MQSPSVGSSHITRPYWVGAVQAAHASIVEREEIVPCDCAQASGQDWARAPPVRARRNANSGTNIFRYPERLVIEVPDSMWREE